MDAGPKRNLKIRYVLLSVIVVITLAGWTGGWFYMRSVLAAQIEDQMAQWNGSGLEVDCPGLGIAGFPFRFEISCKTPSVRDARGRSGAVEAVRTVALVYKPWHIIAEAKGPLRIEDPFHDVSAVLEWKTARSSVIFASAKPDQIDISLEEPLLDILTHDTGSELQAERAELHTRRLPDDPSALDFFLSLQDMTSLYLPELEDRMDVKLHLQLPEGAALAEGATLRELMARSDGALPVRIALASVGNNDMSMELAGQLELSQEGRLSGRVDLALRGPDALAAYLGRAFPQQAKLITSVQGAAVALGQGSRNAEGEEAAGTVRLPLTLKDNRVSIGFLPIGELPSIRIDGVTLTN